MPSVLDMQNNLRANDKKMDNTVPYIKLYKYAAPLDLLLICVGTIASCICGIMLSYFVICFGDVTGIIADYAFSINQNVTHEERVAITKKLFSGTQQFAITTSLIVLAIMFCTYVILVCFTYTSLRQTLKMRKLYFGKVLDQDIAWHDQNSPGDFKNISDNISKIEDGMGPKVGRLFYIGTAFITSVIWAYWKGWKFAVVCLVLFPLKTIVYTVVALYLAKRFKKELAEYKALGIVTWEILHSIRTVVAFGAEEKASRRYDYHIKQAQNLNITRCLFNALNQAFSWFLVYARYAAAFWYGIGLVVDERSLPEEDRVYTPGNVMGIFFLNILISVHLRKAKSYFEIIKTAKVAAYNVFKMLDSEPVRDNHHSEVKKTPNFKSDIVFEHVKFSYSTTPTVQVLNYITMKVGFGETVALVGPPGSGKSTVVQLLRRFLNPTFGSITIDGVNIKDTDKSYLRKNISVVSGEPSLFITTIANNILYGKSTATMDDIVQAAKQANAHKFISNLPYGYQTIIDESDTQFSKDQKIRIALARALIKKPVLLIFDDVTSFLDSDRAVEVQATLDDVSKECTKIVITKKLSSIRNANKIIVFDKGNIIEEGSHQELIEAKGLYFNMINSEEDTELNNENNGSKLSETKTVSFMSYGENKNEAIKEEKEEPGNQPKKIYIKILHFYRPEWLQVVNGYLASLLKGALLPFRSLILGNVLNENTTTKKLCIKILRFCRPEWLQIGAGSLASLLKGASVPLCVLILGNILGVFSITDNVATRMEANFYCLKFLYLGIATGIAIFFQVFCFAYADVKIKNRMKTNLFTTMLKQDIGWFDRKENYVLVLCNHLAYDPLTLQSAGRVGLVLNSFSTLLLSTTIGFYLEWRLTLTIVIFTPLILFAILYARNNANMADNFRRKMLDKSTKVALEALDNIDTIKALGFENTVYESYVKELKSFKSMRFRRSHMRAVILGCIRTSPFFALVGGIVYGGKILSRGEVDSATIFKVLEVSVLSIWTVSNTLLFLPDMQKIMAAASRVFGLFERVPAVKSHRNASQHQWENSNIKFSRISFSYPTKSSVQILNDLDLSIMHGKTVGIVGDRLCGKSTVLELLLRFYDPPYGAVSIDGEDIRNLDLQSLRSQIGIVSQCLNFFDLTIAENIGYGVNDRAVSIEEIIQAAKSANIHNLIVNLPLGYETRFSSIGKQLSESQKQRIAIARALLRNPKILLLDEVTSTLDGESAKVVQEVLDKARQGRTCIIVSQNLTTIKKADVICFLTEGQIKEIGSHDQLFAMKGHYYRYFAEANALLSLRT